MYKNRNHVFFRSLIASSVFSAGTFRESQKRIFATFSNIFFHELEDQWFKSIVFGPLVNCFIKLRVKQGRFHVGLRGKCMPLVLPGVT